MKTTRTSTIVALLAGAVLSAACGKKTPPASPENATGGSGSTMKPAGGGTGGAGYGGMGYGGRK